MTEGVGLMRPDPLLSRFAKAMLTTQDAAARQKYKDRAVILAERRAEEYRAEHPFQPFSDVMPDGAWRGQPCFILAGGPSLIGFDFERLRGRGRIIAINRAFEFCPFADILFLMDITFYNKCHVPGRQEWIEAWNAFQGYRVFLNIKGRQLEDVFSIKTAGRTGLTNRLQNGLCHGNHSGHGAINLAFVLAASPIYLLGYDGKFTNGRAHFHDGYGEGRLEKSYRAFIQDLQRQAAILKKTSTQVFNLNPDSALRAYPFKTIDEVLSNGKTGQDMGIDDAHLPDAASDHPPAGN